MQYGGIGDSMIGEIGRLKPADRRKAIAARATPMPVSA
jgi:hypothetical protein